MRNTSNFFSFVISFISSVLTIYSTKVKADIYELPVHIQKVGSYI